MRLKSPGMAVVLSLSAAALVAAAAAAERCDASEYYSGTDLTLQGTALASALHDRVSAPHTVIPYTDSRTDVWDALSSLDADPADSSRVLLIYSQTSVAASKAGEVSGWNREHLWPKAYGVSYEGPDFTDLHCLRPCDWNVNSARSDLFFGACRAGDGNGCTAPAHREAAGDTAKTREFFMPPAAVRGDIARCLFYMAVRYDGREADTEDLTLTSCPCRSRHAMGNLSALLQWHLDDPVDGAERLRNGRVCAEYQGNRNPFVDHPELVGRLWAQGGQDAVCSSGCSGSSAATTAAPAQCKGARPGDLAVVSFSSDEPDALALLALAPLPGGLEVFVTDNGWTGSGWRITEGRLRYTAPAEGVAAGTVLRWDARRGGGASGSWAVEGSFALSAAGDQLIVYQQCRGAREPDFLFAVTWQASGAWSAPGTALSSQESVAPTALAERGLALALPHRDNYAYAGPTHGVREDLLASIVKPDNWRGSNAPMQNPPAANFNVPRLWATTQQ